MNENEQLIAYVDEKLDILKNHFVLKLSPEEISHFYKLPTEEDVDRYAHTLIMEKL